ncbi:hypothetical protein D3C79_622940 [compost metagenome]
MQVVQICLTCAVAQVLVTGLELVNQLLVQRGDAQPHFTGGHIVDMQLRAIARDEVLEQLVGDVQVFLEFFPALFRVFAKHRHGALVFAGSEHFKVDVMLFQQAVDVRQLRHHADRTENGKRRTDDPVANTGHHVTAAGSNLVDTDGQRNARLTNTCQLRSGQTVAVNHATAALQAQHHFIARRRQAQHGSDLVTQAFSGRSLDVTVKIEHEDPRFVFGGFLLLLLRLGLLLAQGLELGFVQQAAFQTLA